MFSTIFSGLPKGVMIRRLDSKRKAQGQQKGFEFSAWRDGQSPVYANSIRDAIKQLDANIHVHIK